MNPCQFNILRSEQYTEKLDLPIIVLNIWRLQQNVGEYLWTHLSKKTLLIILVYFVPYLKNKIIQIKMEIKIN